MIIRFTNGDVKEVDFYYDTLGEPGCILRNSAWLYRFGNNGMDSIFFDNLIVTEIKNREIENIKLNHIAVYPQPYGNEAIIDDVEIEVY